jgi:4'-phosphopantetheinyl transferase
MSPASTLHLWPINLEDPHWDNWASVLNPKEQHKAQQFKTPTLQHHHRRSRIALRLVLAQHTQQAPQHIDILTSATGKPFLPQHPLHFNLSHSGDQALIGIANTPLGLDIEQLKMNVQNVQELAPSVMHPLELAQFLKLSGSEQIVFFYTQWTQKEAYLKAIGTGLQQAPNTLRTAYGQAVESLDPPHDQAWYSHPVEVPKSYTGSVCTDQKEPLMQYYSAEDILFKEAYDWLWTINPRVL